MALAFSFPEPLPPSAKETQRSLAATLEQAPDAVSVPSAPTVQENLALPSAAQLTELAELMRSQSAAVASREMSGVAKLRQQDEESRRSFDTDLAMLRLRLERLEEHREASVAEQRSDLVHTRNALEERLDDVAASLGRDVRLLREAFETEQADWDKRSLQIHQRFDQLRKQIEGFDERIYKIEAAVSVLQETIKLGVLNLCQGKSTEESGETSDLVRNEKWFEQRLNERLPGLLKELGFVGELPLPVDAEAAPEMNPLVESEIDDEWNVMEEDLTKCSDHDSKKLEAAEMLLEAARNFVPVATADAAPLRLGDFVMQFDLRVGSPPERVTADEPSTSEQGGAIEQAVPDPPPPEENP